MHSFAVWRPIGSREAGLLRTLRGSFGTVLPRGWPWARTADPGGAPRTSGDAPGSVVLRKILRLLELGSVVLRKKVCDCWAWGARRVSTNRRPLCERAMVRSPQTQSQICHVPQLAVPGLGPVPRTPNVLPGPPTWEKILLHCRTLTLASSAQHDATPKEVLTRAAPFSRTPDTAVATAALHFFSRR